MSRDDERESPTGLGAPDSCLSPEVLAAFLDGALEGLEKEGVQAHLATCSDCYAPFAESAEFLRQAPEVRAAVPPSGPGIRGRASVAALLVPLTVAAALVVVLLRPPRVVAPTIVGERGTPVTTRSPLATEPEPVPPSTIPSTPGASALVALLLNVDDSAPLVAAAWRDDPAGLGFTGGGSRDRTFVLLGVHLLDLEVAVRRGDLSATRERLAALEPLAESVAKGPAIRAFAGGLDEGRVAGLDVEGLRAQLGSGATPHGTADASRLIRFGEWVEAGRLAVAMRHSRYFVQPEVKRGLTDAGDLPLPEPIRRALVAVEPLLRPHPVKDGEWRRLGRTLDQVLLLL